MEATDQDFLKLLIKDAVRDGMDDHLKCHKELEAKVDETRRFMWGGLGAASVVSVLVAKLWGK